jgi:PHP family Zn ribbon phosphoesterase
LKLYYDLHMHSCLSPCGGDDMTPVNMAAMCKLAGLDVVALTDHNTTLNCPAFCAAASKLGVIALPGMELCTREEVHVICLFPSLEQASFFCSYVYQHMTKKENNPVILGRQVIMDASDCVVGEESRLLSGATDIGIYDVASQVAQYGGTAFPAHIDRPSFSLLSNLGLWDPGMGFTLAELSHHCPDHFTERSDLVGIRYLSNSDAHELDQICDAQNDMEVSERTPSAVLKWLINSQISENPLFLHV